jgi:hypothetical protein
MPLPTSPKAEETPARADQPPAPKEKPPSIIYTLKLLESLGR